MTFSAQVKQELCKQSMSRRCCAQAEAYGILLYCNTFQANQVRIITESPQFKLRLPQLFRKAFRVEFDVVPSPGEGKCSFLLEDPAKLHTVFDTFGLERDSAVSLHINFAHLEEEHCQTAFFRGAFLAATIWSWPPPTLRWAGRALRCSGSWGSPPRTPSEREIT